MTRNTRTNGLVMNQWDRHIRRARSLNTGQTITVMKSEVSSNVPVDFNYSLFSFPDGANAVYRESKNEYTLQIREYDEHFEIQMDRYHPIHRPMGHLKHDVSEQRAAALKAGGAIAGAMLLARLAE